MKTLLIVAFSLLSLQGDQLDVYRSTHKVKDGMDNLVDVKVTVNQTGADFTLEEAIENRRRIEEEEGMTNIPENEKMITFLVSRASLYTKLYIVKNKATWLPQELFLYWDAENKVYTGAMKGIARNAYNTPGEVQGFVTMDAYGEVKLKE